jgi:hypothetical protein
LVVAVPAAVTSVPAWQSDHGTHTVDALASSSHVPLAQGSAGVSWPAQKLPGAHTEQLTSVVAVPGVLTAEPSAQAVHAAQAVAGFAS